MKPRKRIDYFIDDALHEFHRWLRGDGGTWRAKEWDTVAVFVDVFLRKQVGPGAAVAHQSQIRTESQVATDTARGWRGVRKDVVIWPEPFMSCWDRHRTMAGNPCAAGRHGVQAVAGQAETPAL